MERVDKPKVFIFYAWSSEEYKQKVLSFADQLLHDGVDVLLDRYLAPGIDLTAFMESSVNDESVTNVLILMDKVYTEKANKRQGGVGTETQIISPELYGKVEQTKFIRSSCSGKTAAWNKAGMGRFRAVGSGKEDHRI